MTHLGAKHVDQCKAPASAGSEKKFEIIGSLMFVAGHKRGLNHDGPCKAWPAGEPASADNGSAPKLDVAKSVHPRRSDSERVCQMALTVRLSSPT